LKPIFTTIVIFYNGQREAKRTLYTLKSSYQGVNPDQYKVLVLDSGSSQKIDEQWVESFGKQFSYKYIATDHPSPVEALQYGLDVCETPYIMVCIDGARMLSPGIFKKSLDIIKVNKDALITTTGFHIGKHHQNYSVLNGYNQEVEDKLIGKINWKKNGYSLFHISSLHQDGYSYFSLLAESNCFVVKTSHLREISFHQGFISKGGGLINLSVFKDLIEIKKLQVYALIGEATFHQFHGGAASNISMADHPVQEYRFEYKKIMGKEFSVPKYNPIYYGGINENIIDLKPKYEAFHILKTCNYLISNNKASLALEILKEAIIDYPYHSAFLIKLNRILLRQGRLNEGLQFINAAIKLTPHHPFLYLHRAKYNFKLEKWESYKTDILTSLEKYKGNLSALIEIYDNHKLFNYSKKEAEDLLIINSNYITKVVHLKKILTVLIKQNQFVKAQEIINETNQNIINNYEITILRINLSKKTNCQKNLNILLEKLYDEVLLKSKLPTKLLLRISQIFISNNKHKFANQIIKELIKHEEYVNIVNTITDTSNQLQDRQNALLSIFPKLNQKNANAFLKYKPDKK